MPGNAPYKPEQAQLAVAVEPEQGTQETPVRFFGLVQEDTSLPDPSIEWIQERVIGHDREIFNKVEGQRAYEGGSIPIVPYDGFPLALAFGQETVRSGTDIEGNSVSGVTTHILEANQTSKPPTTTIEASYRGTQGQPEFTRQFLGATPGSGEIAVNNEGELQVALDMIAMDVDTEETITSVGSVPDRDPWLFADNKSALTIFGTEFARVEEFTVSITNNLEQGRYIQPDDPRKPYEIIYGIVEYEVSASITIDDKSVYNELIEPTAGGFDMSISFEKENTGEELRIIGEDCNIPEAPHDIPGDASQVQVDVPIIPNSLRVEIEDNTSAGSGYLANSGVAYGDVTAPTISNWAASNPTADQLLLSLETDEKLDDLVVEVVDEGEDEVVDRLYEQNFSETETSGTYSYESTYSVGEISTYKGRLITMKDESGNDAASGDETTVVNITTI